MPSVNLKRRYDTTAFDDGDSENVDPAMYNSPTKKNKMSSTDGYQTPKTTNFMNPTSMNALKSSLERQLRSIRRSDPFPTKSQRHDLMETPTNSVRPTTAPTPRNIDSAPAVAGRSPKSKRIGILSRRRMTSSPFTRVNPPLFASNSIQGGLPFSIDAALASTVPSYKPNSVPVEAKKVQVKRYSTLEESIPQGWMFDIYEETEEMQEQNVVVHRACNLDISDDEHMAESKDNRGKENIPPCDGGPAGVNEVTTAIPASRKNMMTDEPRTPLGDLETSDFYAEGCEASSYITIPDEISTDQFEGNSKVKPEPAKDISFPGLKTTEVLDGWKDFLAHDTASAPTVDIWESESAKEEDEAQGCGEASHCVI